MSPSSLFSCICLLNLLFISSGALIDDTCRKTPQAYESFCTRTLISDSRARNARNADELGLVVIDLASYSATGTKVKIHDRYVGTNDPQLKQRLSVCDTYYADAVAVLRDATNELKQGHYVILKSQGAKVDDDGSSCENAFRSPPAIASPLTNENFNLQGFGEIIVAIATR